jgi:NitT/TauT family transport system substrate-binding protein
MVRRWTAVVLASVLLAAIGSHSEAAEKLRVGVLKLASSGGVFVAAERGYFTAEGVDVELRFFDAAQPIAVAAVAGDIDVGVTGLTAGFYNLAGKGALRIIAGQSREERGYHLIAYLASNRAYDAGLTTLKHLPGHTVGISQVGSTFHYSIGLLAEKLGFPLSSLKLVPLQSMANMAAALKGNQVDASLIPATIALPMIARGEAHGLGWVGDETPWQLGAIFTTAHAIAERRAALEKFLLGYRGGARPLYETFVPNDGTPRRLSDDAGGLLAILAKYTGQTPDQLRDGIPYIDPDAKLLVGDIARQVAWYQSQGLVDRSVEAGTILDLSFTDGPAAAQ